MSRIFTATAFLACLMLVVTHAQSQDGGKGQKGPMNRNGGPPLGGPGGPGGFGMNPQDLMQRLAALDTNGDGALTSTCFVNVKEFLFYQNPCNHLIPLTSRVCQIE